MAKKRPYYKYKQDVPIDQCLDDALKHLELAQGALLVWRIKQQITDREGSQVAEIMGMTSKTIRRLDQLISNRPRK